MRFGFGGLISSLLISISYSGTNTPTQQTMEWMMEIILLLSSSVSGYQSSSSAPLRYHGLFLIPAMERRVGTEHIIYGKASGTAIVLCLNEADTSVLFIIEIREQVDLSRQAKSTR